MDSGEVPQRCQSHEAFVLTCATCRALAISDEEFDQLLDIATHGSEDMRLMVAGSPRTPDEIIFFLLEDEVPGIRDRADQQRVLRGLTSLDDVPENPGDHGGHLTTEQSAPPGWHSLPNDPLVEGYWDGAAWTGQRRSAIILTTTESLPGFAISRVMGLVVGIGHPSGPVWTSTRGRSFEAIDQALRQLQDSARALGADAVIGLTHAVYSGGNRSAFQAVGAQVMGTAVSVTPLTGMPMASPRLP